MSYIYKRISHVLNAKNFQLDLCNNANNVKAFIANGVLMQLNEVKLMKQKKLRKLVKEKQKETRKIRKMLKILMSKWMKKKMMKNHQNKKMNKLLPKMNHQLQILTSLNAKTKSANLEVLKLFQLEEF